MFKDYIRALGWLNFKSTRILPLVFINIFLGVAFVFEPILFGRFIDALVGNGDVFNVLLIWVIFAVVCAILNSISSIAVEKELHRSKMQAVQTTFSTSIEVSESFHARSGSGAILRSIIVGSDALYDTWRSFIKEQIVAITTVFLLIYFATSINFQISAVLLALASFYAVTNYFLFTKTTRSQIFIERLHVRFISRIDDVIKRISTIKMLSLEGRERDFAQRMAMRIAATQQPIVVKWSVLGTLNFTVSMATIVIIVVLGYQFHLSGTISVGEIVTLISFSRILTDKLGDLSACVARYFILSPTLRELFSLVDAPKDTFEGESVVSITSPPELEFRNVSFSYPSGQQAISNLSFKIGAGETTAIVGETGSGKSTILKLLQGSITSADGAIFINGKDLSTYSLSAYRKIISCVPQEERLFNRSLLMNIEIGKEEATDDEIRKAACLAQADDFITALPDGYYYRAGSDGSQLSGGQRQRIVIARALLRDGPLLLMDEPTSALDAVTEDLIYQSLKTLRKRRTVVLCTHRLWSLRHVDKILVIDRGRLTEEGTFEELREKDGKFASLLKEDTESM